MNKMKTIGLIGGMSFESSAEYYRIINEEVRCRMGGNNSARIILYSVNFQEIEDLQFQGSAGWTKLEEEMISIAHRLETAGADCVAICTNLMHRTAPAVKKEISIPLIHIAEETGRAIAEDGLKRVGLLGALFTMKENFYRETLKHKFNLETLIPEEAEMEEVSRIIYKELCQGKFLPESKEYLLEVAGRLGKNGAQAVILGCTELPLVLKNGQGGIPFYDTTAIHAGALAEFALVDFVPG